MSEPTWLAEARERVRWSDEIGRPHLFEHDRAMVADYAALRQQLADARAEADALRAVADLMRKHPCAVAFTAGGWVVWHREGCPARAQSFSASFDTFDAAVAHALVQYGALDAARGEGEG